MSLAPDTHPHNLPPGNEWTVEELAIHFEVGLIEDYAMPDIMSAIAAALANINRGQAFAGEAMYDLVAALYALDQLQGTQSRIRIENNEVIVEAIHA